MQKFSGVWTALITPMTESGVDYEALQRLVEYQIEGGVDGIVSVGTTGESPTLDSAEHIVVIQKTVEYAKGRIPVIAGTGSNSTREAIELTRDAEEAGADGFLVVAPYYNKPSQEGVFRHMGEIAKITQKPIMLYSIPGRCGIEIANDTVLRLRDKFENICALKEAGGRVEKVKDLFDRAHGAIDILSGDDALTVEFMKNGATGIVSVASNVIPERMAKMTAYALKGDWAKAQELSDKMHDFFKSLFIEPNPVPAKTAMLIKGLIDNAYVRLPLCEMPAEKRAVLETEMKKLGV